MRNLFFLSVIVLFLTACEKDQVASSKHRFSAEQQKAVETFIGEWEGVQNSFFTHPDCLSFGWHSDTNVVMYEDDYLHGQVEVFEYQGEVTLRDIQWTSSGYDTTFIPCWYYVNSQANRIDLYRKDDHKALWKRFELEFVSSSQFKVRYYYSSTYDYHWCTFNKIEN